MPKVIIVGAGIAGLATGIAFRQSGWDVNVIERAPHLEPMGAALSLWPNACAAMSTLGVLPAIEAVAAPIRSVLLATKDEKPIFKRTIPDKALLVTRSALQTALAGALGNEPLRLNCAVSTVGSMHVELADGETIAGDLIIDAGGIRALSALGRIPRYAGYGGVLALTKDVSGQSLNGLAAEYWGENERFGVFELPNGGRYWFYMRTQPSAAAMPSLEECCKRSQSWPLSVQQAVLATDTAALIPFAVHANAPPSSLHSQGILRVGDAAHAMEPNLGQGACQGLEDAAALHAIASVHRPLDLAARYQQLRLNRARMFVRESAQARFGVHSPTIVRTVVRAVLGAIPSFISERAIRRMQTMPYYAANGC
jgi:2-polyprenyl-6-methoxyphenol hydroxylase-like FAD-dependent oxidoreductase